MASLQEEITKKADLLSKEALQEKTELLARKKKDLERTLGDKEEALRAELQREQIKLRDKQMAVANTMCESECWALVIDKNTPGVLFVNKSIDKTKELLVKVDELFDKTNATKQDNVVVATNKTAAKPATKTVETKKA